MSQIIFFVYFYALWAILLFLVLTILRFEYRSQNPAIFLWVAIIAVYVVPSLFDPFNNSTQILTGPFLDLTQNWLLIRAHLFAVLFCAVYLAVRLAMRGVSGDAPSAQLSPADLPAALIRDKSVSFFLLAGVLVLGLALLLEVLAIVPRAGWSGLLSGSFSSYRLESDATLKILGYYLIYAMGGLLFIAWFSGRKSLATLIATIVFTVFIFGRTRQLLFPAIMPFALYFIYRAKGFRGWSFLISGVVAAYVFILALQIFRYQGSILSGVDALSGGEFYLSIFQALQEERGEAVIRLIYYYFMADGVQIPEFMTGLTYYRVALLPIPSALLGDLKPIDYDMILYQFYYGSGLDIGATIHPLIFGNAYANFGWLGIFLGGFWALLFGILNAYRKSRTLLHQVMIMSIVGFLSVMISRGSIYNSLTIIFWTLLFLEAFFFVLRHLDAAKKQQMFYRPPSGPSHPEI